MKDENIGEWLTKLASAEPAPGGGAAAALNLATGAALVSMVCNLTIGKPKYEQFEQAMTDALQSAEKLRTHALELVTEDAAAFTAVTNAYRLPKSSAEEKATRSSAIQSALVYAADVPLKTAMVARDVIRLCSMVLDGSNVNVVSDVAVAADSARAALRSAMINVEINMAAMTDSASRTTLREKLSEFDDILIEADEVVAGARKRIG